MNRPAEARHPKAGVIGWPVDRALSPPSHRFWLREPGSGGEDTRPAVNRAARRRELHLPGANSDRFGFFENRRAAAGPGCVRGPAGGPGG